MAYSDPDTRNYRWRLDEVVQAFEIATRQFDSITGFAAKIEGSGAAG